MSRDWPSVSLEDVAAELTVGHVGSMASEYVSEGVPFLRSQNVEPHRVNLADIKYISREFDAKLKKSKLRPGDVVIVRTGKPGACSVVPDWLEEANCSDLVIVRCGPRIRPKFLAYVVNGVAGHHIDSHLVGAVQQHFNVGAARKLKLSLPSLAEQDGIVEVLGSLDDKIDLNRRTNETLEAMARAVFKSWFVDFDPVHAKAAGKAPAHMDAETAALFPDAFGEDGLPVGWRTEAIGEHFKALKGLSYKGNGLSDSGMPLFNLNSVLEGGGYKYDGLKFYAGDFKPKHEAGPGDLLIANTEQGFDHLLIGFSTLVPPSQGKGIFSHHLYKVQARPKTHLNTFYLHFLLSASPQGEAIRRYSNGTTVNMLPADAFERPRITVPPVGVVAAFSEFVTPIAEKQDAAVAENQTLAALRDLLLPKLMSGELRLRDAEKIVEGAA